MSKEIKKLRRKRSIFCEQKPDPKLTWAAVFLKDLDIWVVCQGKIQKNGYLRYTNNGKISLVGPQYYRCYSLDYTREMVQENVDYFNIQNLKSRCSVKKKQRNWIDIANDVIYEPGIAIATPAQFDTPPDQTENPPEPVYTTPIATPVVPVEPIERLVNNG